MKQENKTTCRILADVCIELSAYCKIQKNKEQAKRFEKNAKLLRILSQGKNIKKILENHGVTNMAKKEKKDKKEKEAPAEDK